MKIKIFIVSAILFWTAAFSQAEYEKLKITENVEDNSAVYVNVQSSDNQVNKRLISTLIPPVTTAGTFTRVNFTGDQTVLGAGTFYNTNTVNKGSIASAAQSVTNNDNEKKYFALDFISVLQPSLVLYPPGTYAGQFAVQVTDNAANQRFTIEIYKTDSTGAPIASGVAGAPVGSLGVTVVAILDSSLLNLAANTLTNITLSGPLTGQLTVNANERIRYHISAEKVGTAGAASTMTIFYGTSYNSYYDVPVPVTTDGVTNKSTVTGANTTVALNTLNSALSSKSDKANFVNIKDLGGIGNGIFDNTTIINNALLTYKEVYFPDGNYLVTSLVNEFGSKITGSGVIIKAITGGTQQLNTGLDWYNYIHGQEYLSFFQNKIIARGNGVVPSLSIFWSGDSTTAGDGTDVGYRLNELFDETCLLNGISNIRSTNKGHSSKNTEDWRTTYLPSDLAGNPDLYIIRWGLNDPSDGRTIQQFETSLRSGLATIRASKTQAQMSILLMTPNTISDTPNSRDEKWLEQVRKICLKASRDYQCAYIDTYSMWLDSRNGAAGLFMDDPFSDGRAIHPKNVFNTWIVSKVFDLVFPITTRNRISSSHVTNTSYQDFQPTKATLPEQFRKGVNVSTAYGVPAWSVDGTATTVFSADGSGYQFNTSRSLTNPRFFFRSFMNDYLVTPLAWSNEVELWHTGNLTPITGTGSSGQITFWNGSASQTGDGGLFWDNTTKQLQIKVTSVPNKQQLLGYDNTNDRAYIQAIEKPSTYKTLVLQPDGGSVQIGGLNGSGDAYSIVDSSGKLKRGDAVISGVKKYVATLTLSGTSDPVATVMDNTYGGTVVWTRTGLGSYAGTLTGAFTVDKTVVFVTRVGNVNILSAGPNTANTVSISSWTSGGSSVDASMNGVSVEIRTYP